MPSRTMEVLTKGTTLTIPKNVAAIPSSSSQKPYGIKVQQYEDIKYYELPESTIPRGWSNDPLLLQDVLTAVEMEKNYGFEADIKDIIAIVMSDDGECRLMFEVQFGGQAHFYEWNPLTSVLQSVSGGDNIIDFLDALDKGHEIVGPEVPYRDARRNRTSLM